MSTASAFTKVGGWIVKLRVSAPGDRQPTVEAALDAFLAAAQIDADAILPPIAPLDFAAPCPAAASGKVKAVKTDKSGANALGTAIMAMPIDAPKKKGDKDDTPLPPPFPANGLTKVCSRGPLPGTPLEALQPAGEGKAGPVIVVLSDTGDVAAVVKNLIDDNYTIVRSRMGTLVVLGEIDRLPDNDELLRIFGGGVPGALDTRITVDMKANGDSTIGINSSFLK